MKKILTSITSFLLAITALFYGAGCGNQNERYVLTEQTFFLVMTNMQYYPEQYLGCDVEYDCFTYKLTDVNGTEYLLGVRKCSSGFGCTCGKDTIIGFILSYDGEIPQPRNQSEDSPDKTWVHIKGQIKDANKRYVTVNAYGEDGQILENQTETIAFLEFNVDEITLIEDWSGLSYYVTK